MNSGEIWGKWVIRRYLGGGGMGDVFLALNLETSREVAVKRVRRSPGTEGEEKIAAERMGAELEQRLGEIDARVTKVFWFGDVEGDLAIEMEYIDGEDLAARLERGPLDAGRAAVIAAELCEMLRNLRGLGVIHGDLKPKNVRIKAGDGSRDEIKVMDFGVAKALSESRDFTASLFGSIAYCSPERLDKGSMDLNSDLWSVGVMLYQMVSGRLPFEGSTPEKLERRIRGTEPPPPLPDECPDGLRRIVAKMLDRKLEDRYATETEARDDVERFLRGAAVVAPATVDLNATMRTVAPVDLNATIRTDRPFIVARRGPIQVPWKQIAIAGAVLVMFGIWLVGPQYLVWAATRELKHEIEAEKVDAGEAWTKYQQIVARSHLGLMTWGIGGPLKAKLVAAGDRPIIDFRNNDYLSAREPQWRQSVQSFTRALEVDPSDPVVKAKLRLCEAHVERITASGAARQTMLNEAAMKFEEAADLWKKSPDPYLGLERLYAYADPDKAQAAADKAKGLGHEENKREMTQRADGYLLRAQQTVKDAHKIRGLDLTERNYLFHARQDFERARDLYSRVGSFANAQDRLMDSVRGLDQLHSRLKEMDVSNP
jgi:eukaryotic-like serine/threonine-protein kinase